MRMGGMDRVKFYILQINRLYPAALDDVVKKWKECTVWLQLAGMHNDIDDTIEPDRPADDEVESDNDAAGKIVFCTCICCQRNTNTFLWFFLLSDMKIVQMRKMQMMIVWRLKISLIVTMRVKMMTQLLQILKID